MIDTSLLSNDLWEPAAGEKYSSKLIVTDKILKKARNHYCGCIFCNLKGEDRKNEELIEKVIMDYVTNYENLKEDYMLPINLLKIIGVYIYDDFKEYTGSSDKTNLPPFLKSILKSGFSQSEMDKILEKFTYRISNSSYNLSDDLPF
jgi:hypothetical protein